MAVTATQTAVLAGSALVVGIAVAVAVRRRGHRVARRTRRSWARAQRPRRGRSLVIGDRISLEDWETWMRDDGPRALRTALQEGSKTPEEIAANLLRRLAPDHVWPPSDGSPLWTDYSKIVAAIGRTLDQPFKTRFLVVS